MRAIEWIRGLHNSACVLKHAYAQNLQASVEKKVRTRIFETSVAVGKTRAPLETQRRSVQGDVSVNFTTTEWEQISQ